MANSTRPLSHAELLRARRVLEQAWRAADLKIRGLKASLQVNPSVQTIDDRNRLMTDLTELGRQILAIDRQLLGPTRPASEVETGQSLRPTSPGMPEMSAASSER